MEMSNELLISVPSADCKAGGVALQRVRRALRRRSARVRLLILPSLLRRPTLRLFGAPVVTTATSLFNTLADTSLESLMVSFRDSSLVRPDLQINTDTLIFVCKTVAMTHSGHNRDPKTPRRISREIENKSVTLYCFS